MSYWLSVIVFWEISQMFNQNRSSQGCRKFLFCPAGGGGHNEVFLHIQVKIHSMHFMQASEMIECWKNLHCSFFDFHPRDSQVQALAPSPYCLHPWRHICHTEIMIVKFYLIVLSHPTRKSPSLWTPAFICSWTGRSRQVVELRAPLSLPAYHGQNQLFWWFVALPVFLYQHPLPYWTPCCVMHGPGSAC